MDYIYNKVSNVSDIRYQIEQTNLPYLDNIFCNVTKESTVLSFARELTESEKGILDNIVDTINYNEVPLKDLELKIYDYIPNTVIDKTVVPKGHNYKTGLTTSLYPKRFFVHGELQKVEWYSDKELTDLIIVAEMTYTRDSLGFALDRKTIRKWVMRNGNFSNDYKMSEKDYTANMVSQINEGIRRRKNIVDNTQKPILGLMLQTISPNTGETEEERQSRVLKDGRQFIINNNDILLSYAECSNREFLDKLSNYTINDYYWLYNIIDGSGNTIRNFIFKEFDIWGEYDSFKGSL